MKTRVCLLIGVLGLLGCTDSEPPRGIEIEDAEDAGVVVVRDTGGQSDLDAGESDSGVVQVDAGRDSGEQADAGPDMAFDGTSIGKVWNTYYWLADEAEHPGPQTVELLDRACQPVGTVSEDYADALCIEGSGKLDDGTVVNYASLCDCGRPCSSGNIICWSALDGAQYPWGQGAFSNALEPLRSLAVDRDFLPLRTVVYIEQFDGFDVPSLGGVEGFVHDGCFRADDVGGAIEGNHIDIMAGTTQMWRHMETVFPTRGELDAFTGVGKCAYLEL